MGMVVEASVPFDYRITGGYVGVIPIKIETFNSRLRTWIVIGMMNNLDLRFLGHHQCLSMDRSFHWVYEDQANVLGHHRCLSMDRSFYWVYEDHAHVLGHHRCLSMDRSIGSMKTKPMSWVIMVFMIEGRQCAISTVLPYTVKPPGIESFELAIGSEQLFVD
ncbi:hypothetical protein AMTR_s00260p00018650, partial [Amborella trichopoda]